MTDGIRIGGYNDHDDATLTVDVSVVTGFEAENTQNTIRSSSSTLRSADVSGPMTITGVVSDNRVASWRCPTRTLSP